MRAFRITTAPSCVIARRFLSTGSSSGAVAEEALAHVQRFNADGVTHFRAGTDEGLVLATACFSRALRGMDQVPDAAREEQAVLEAATLVNLANVQRRTALSETADPSALKGKLVDPAGFLERAAALCEKALGPEHKRVAKILRELGLVRELMGEHGRAAESLKRACTIAVESDAVQFHGAGQDGDTLPVTTAALERVAFLTDFARVLAADGQDPTVVREQLFEALGLIESLGDAKTMNPQLLEGLKLLQSYQTSAGEDTYGTEEAVRLYSFLRETAIEDFPELDKKKE